jgi:hypothetical protein
MFYGVSPIIQKELVDKYCFGSCGKIIVGAVDGGDYIGYVFPCREDNCPHEEKRSEVLGDVNGESFCMRKLKDACDENATV